MFGMALDKELRKAIVDRLESWEIVEFLQVDPDYIIELLEDEILEHLDDIKEMAGLEDLNNEDLGNE